MFKELAVIGAGVIAGDMLFTNFLAKRYDKDGKVVGGFIEVEPGFGMDDVVHAGVIAVSILVLSRFLRKAV